MTTFRHGVLNHDNAEQIAKRIAETLAGKLFAVSAGSTNKYARHRLDTNQILRSDWVDKVPSLVRVSTAGDVASITFCDCEYVYTYTAHRSTATRLKTKFVFERQDEFYIEDALPSNNGDESSGPELRKLVFRVQDDLGPVDELDFCSRDVAVNLCLAGRRNEMTEAMLKSLDGKIPLTYDVKQ